MGTKKRGLPPLPPLSARFEAVPRLPPWAGLSNFVLHLTQGPCWLGFCGRSGVGRLYFVNAPPPLCCAAPHFNNAGGLTITFSSLPTPLPPPQDGMHTAWDVGAAADAIINALRAQPGTAVLLSFDRGGVTGHPNHAATAAAVGRVAAARPSLPVGAPPTGTRHLTVPLTASSPTANPSQARRTVAAVASWRLRSLPWYLAWLGPAALVVVPALVGRPRRSGREGKGGPITILSAPTGPAAVLRGLAAHSSQLTWWRVLGALARSASYVSVLEEIRG